MVIKWTPLAIEQLQNFEEISKAEKNNIKEYIKSLVVFTNNILYNNKLEKVMFKLNKIIFRQLLYKQHRINYLLY